MRLDIELSAVSLEEKSSLSVTVEMVTSVYALIIGIVEARLIE